MRQLHVNFTKIILCLESITLCFRLPGSFEENVPPDFPLFQCFGAGPTSPRSADTAEAPEPPLQSARAWPDPRYAAVKQSRVDAGKIQLGKGCGGSVIRAGEEAT